MRIGIIGGGPAGLYLAILLKQAQPSHDIAVVERNPAGATYGWGVVFSPDTLTELRDADYATWLHLDDAIVRWEALEVRYRGRIIRAGGQGFSAISRRTLLRLLQERAAALGVDLRFEQEVDGVAAFADRDVVVAADGVNSAVRRGREDAFGTSYAPHATRFAWFGADRPFDRFTFIFEETDAGLFTVHAYPFDDRRSTFIVEVGSDTFERAGLGDLGEQGSLRRCEEVFADHLDGAALLSNRSNWITFTTVRNRSWRDGNVLLLGDAAHTAHFTIGSGTKLAMEGAVALAKAFVAHGDDLDAVATAYESERQPPVERFQRAATESSRWFAEVPRYLGADPEPFAFNLLTRSGRVTHADVARGDPTFGALVDGWFARDAAADDGVGSAAVDADGDQRGGATPPGPLITAPPPALVAWRVAGVAVGNRVVVAPPPTDDATDGVPGAASHDALVTAAGRGAGLVVTEPVACSAHGRVTLGAPGIWHDDQVAAWAAIGREVRARGGRLGLRLGHAGRRGSTRPRRGGLDRPLRGVDAWTTLAPSPLPYTPRSPAPAAVDARTRAEVLEDLRGAAANARSAEVDVLVVDLSDGYLLASYLSPLTNHRDDADGGDLDARLRFPCEAVDAVVDAWGGPVVARLTVDDRRRGGTTPDDGVAVARTLAAHGVTAVIAVGGHTVPGGAPDYRPRYGVDLADRVRHGAEVATVAVGRITTLDDVDTVLAAGRADACILDPHRYLEPRIVPA